VALLIGPRVKLTREAPLPQDSLSPPADADALMSRLMGLFAELKGRLEPELEELTQGPIAAPIMATVDASGFGYNQARHVIQQASMVSHLHRRGLLAQGSTCIEVSESAAHHEGALTCLTLPVACGSLVLDGAILAQQST
jgi:hypothetical protein